MTSTIKNIVTKDNLFGDHFEFDSSAKKIKVKFPSAPAGSITNLTADNAEHKLKFSKDGTPQEIDLTSLVTDIHITNASFNGKTLTLTPNSGANVTVDFTSLLNDAKNDGLQDVQDAFGTVIGKWYGVEDAAV